MGNVCSEREKETCIICWEEFDDKIHIVCIICNIYIHRNCMDELLKTTNYYLCPHCKSVGSLMTSKVPTYYDKSIC